jgi:hypothetical protein
VSLRTRGVVACAAGLLAAGCSADPVRIDAPALSDADAAACSRLIADLPDTVAGEEAREVSPDGAPGAAWGDPPITLTCGVGRPTGFTDTSTCIEVDRTGWFVPDAVLLSDDESVDVPMTEMNYRPRVHVVVPGDYRPDGFTNTAAAVAKVIEQDLRRVGRCRA